MSENVQEGRSSKRVVPAETLILERSRKHVELWALWAGLLLLFVECYKKQQHRRMHISSHIANVKNHKNLAIAKRRRVSCAHRGHI